MKAQDLNLRVGNILSKVEEAVREAVFKIQPNPNMSAEELKTQLLSKDPTVEMEDNGSEIKCTCTNPDAVKLELNKYGFKIVEDDQVNESFKDIQSCFDDLNEVMNGDFSDDDKIEACNKFNTSVAECLKKNKK